MFTNTLYSRFQIYVVKSGIYSWTIKGVAYYDPTRALRYGTGGGHFKILKNRINFNIL